MLKIFLERFHYKNVSINKCNCILMTRSFATLLCFSIHILDRGAMQHGKIIIQEVQTHAGSYVILVSSRLAAVIDRSRAIFIKF